jgi:hypothetical protein
MSCHVGPSRVRNHLLERMWVASIRHIEMAREPTALRVVVTSAVELVLGHSPVRPFRWKSRTSWLPNFGS